VKEYKSLAKGGVEDVFYWVGQSSEISAETYPSERVDLHLSYKTNYTNSRSSWLIIRDSDPCDF